MCDFSGWKCLIGKPTRVGSLGPTKKGEPTTPKAALRPPHLGSGVRGHLGGVDSLLPAYGCVLGRATLAYKCLSTEPSSQTPLKTSKHLQKFVSLCLHVFIN